MLDLVLLFKSIPDWLATIFIAMLPVGELRAAIPIAMTAYGMNPLEAFLLSVVGNILPVIPLLLFLEPVSNHLRKWRTWDSFFTWLFTRTRRNHSETFEKYGAVGLTLFVAIPLPATGAWTGCAAAFVFGMKFSHALAAIILGILIAGILVTAATLAGTDIINGKI
jgi:uncharacterized membrane protein